MNNSMRSLRHASDPCPIPNRTQSYLSLLLLTPTTRKTSTASSSSVWSVKSAPAAPAVTACCVSFSPPPIGSGHCSIGSLSVGTSEVTDVVEFVHGIHEIRREDRSPSSTLSSGEHIHEEDNMEGWRDPFETDHFNTVSPLSCDDIIEETSGLDPLHERRISGSEIAREQFAATASLDAQGEENSEFSWTPLLNAATQNDSSSRSCYPVADSRHQLKKFSISADASSTPRLHGSIHQRKKYGRLSSDFAPNPDRPRLYFRKRVSVVESPSKSPALGSQSPSRRARLSSESVPESVESLQIQEASTSPSSLATHPRSGCKAITLWQEPEHTSALFQGHRDSVLLAQKRFGKTGCPAIISDLRVTEPEPEHGLPTQVVPALATFSLSRQTDSRRISLGTRSTRLSGLVPVHTSLPETKGFMKKVMTATAARGFSKLRASGDGLGSATSRVHSGYLVYEADRPGWFEALSRRKKISIN